jgi:hypothetical protein
MNNVPTVKQFSNGPMPNGTSANTAQKCQQNVPHYLAHVNDASASKDSKLALCSKSIFVSKVT